MVPVNPIVSHMVAFALGMVLLVLLYILGDVVFEAPTRGGPPQQDVEAPADRTKARPRPRR